MTARPVRHLLVFGETGKGKSTLINSLRDEKELGENGPAITSTMVRKTGFLMTTDKMEQHDMKDIGLGHDVVLWDTIGIASHGDDGSMDPMAKIIHGLRAEFKTAQTPLWGVLVVVDSASLNGGELVFQFVKRLVDEKLVASMKHAILVGTKWEKRDEQEMEAFETGMVHAFFEKALNEELIDSPNWAATGYTMTNDKGKPIPQYVYPQGNDETFWEVEFDGGMTRVDGAVVVETNATLEGYDPSTVEGYDPTSCVLPPGYRVPPTLEFAIKKLPDNDADLYTIDFEDDDVITVMATSVFGSILESESQKTQFKELLKKMKEEREKKDAEIAALRSLNLSLTVKDASAKLNLAPSKGGYSRQQIRRLAVFVKNESVGNRGLDWVIGRKDPTKDQMVDWLRKMVEADQKNGTSYVKAAQQRLDQEIAAEQPAAAAAAAGKATTVVLRVTKGPPSLEGKEFSQCLNIYKRRAWIGRAQKCEIALTGPNGEKICKTVSEKHVCIELSDGPPSANLADDIYIIDYSSTNGTSINGKLLQRGRKSKSKVLTKGMEIRLAAEEKEEFVDLLVVDLTAGTNSSDAAGPS